MPRACSVTVEDAVAVIEKFIEHFREESYPKYSSNIWQQMSEPLEGKWTKHNVYVNVKNNRRKILSIACLNQGIAFPGDDKKNEINDSTLNESSLNVIEDLNEFETESAGLDEFKIHITADEWKQMKGPLIKYKERNYRILEKDVWTDVLSIIISDQTNLPCAFVFKQSKIYETPNSVHYLRIRGRCKSKKCGNIIFCYVNQDPGDAAFEMIVKTRDTYHDAHEDVKRPLRGFRRQQVGQQVFYEGAANWQKREVMKGKVEPRIPTYIPSLEILSKAKKDYVHQILDIKQSDGKDVVDTIEKMRHTAPYQGFIHEVKREKFYASFSTPAQQHAYNKYCQIMKQDSCISIDGTGSIVKPLIRYDGSQSGHIFLYSIVINFEKTTLSVHDLLTESQETETIWWWLCRWQKLGAARPAQAVCDSSRALLNGMSQAFNYQTIKTYVETCFLYASKVEEYYYRPPINTFIRLDVAHFMAMIRRWRCMKNMRHRIVRQFYLYCIALMVDSQTLEQFREIFLLTCIVASHEFQDSKIEAIPGGTVLDARQQLEAYIATRNVLTLSEDEIIESDDFHSECDIEHSTYRSRIKDWINDLRTSATEKCAGTEPNSFFFDDFIDRFVSVAYEFPLWTSAAIPQVTGRATSTHSEGHFHDVKNRVFKNYAKPLRCDKFLKLEYQDNSGSAAIISSKLTNFDLQKRQQSNPFFKCSQNKAFKAPANNVKLDLDENQNVADSNINKNIDHSTPKGHDKVSLPMNEILDDISEVLTDTDFDNNNNKQTDCFDAVNKINIVERKKECFKEKKLILTENCDTDFYSKENILAIPRKTVINKSKGFYFRPRPEIQHQTTLIMNNRKSSLLKNGSLMNRPVSLNGVHYFVYNTCGFDSIIQILATAAMDDPYYMAAVKSSKNETLRFVHKFVEIGPCAALYKERTMLLNLLFHSRVKSQYNACTKLSSYIIDVWDNLATIWKTCFYSEPSAVHSHDCPKCEMYNCSVPTLGVNHKLIGEHGFGAMQQALVLNNPLRKVLCRTPNCSQLCTVNVIYNSLIFIELDIRPDIQATHGLECKLEDFPATLDFHGHKYRLVGVVEALPGHFVAYCKRQSGIWELCNDCSSKITHPNSSKKIEPNGIIYIRITTEINPFPLIREPLDDSDTTSRDNWRNKGFIEDFHSDISFENEILVSKENNIQVCHQVPSDRPTISVNGKTLHVIGIQQLKP